MADTVYKRLDETGLAHVAGLVKTSLATQEAEITKKVDYTTIYDNEEVHSAALNDLETRKANKTVTSKLISAVNFMLEKLNEAGTIDSTEYNTYVITDTE